MRNNKKKITKEKEEKENIEFELSKVLSFGDLDVSNTIQKSKLPEKDRENKEINRILTNQKIRKSNEQYKNVNCLLDI